jgi:hypothetical protein
MKSVLDKHDLFLVAFCGFFLSALVLFFANVIAFQIIYVGIIEGQWWGYSMTLENLHGYWNWRTGRILIVIDVLLFAFTLLTFQLMESRYRGTGN